MIVSLLVNFRPLLVNPELARRIGLNEAIVLQQVKYWTLDMKQGVEHEGRQWVYNTYQQWVEQFPFWSPDTIRRTVKSLTDQGILAVEKLNKVRHDQTNYYAINTSHSALFDAANFASSSMGNSPDVHSKITTETTSSIRQQADSIPYDEIERLYNEVCGKVFKKSISMTAKRKGNIKKLATMTIAGKKPFKEHGLIFWEAYFHDCLKNKHWRGDNDRGWKADLEFITRPDNVAKILETVVSDGA